MHRAFLVLVLMAALAGCGFAYDDTLVGRYRLVGVDSAADIMLCWSLDRGDCVGDGLPERVIAAGFDDRFVVTESDTNASPARANAEKRSYYYIDRRYEDQRTDAGLPYRGIHGPLTRDQFAAVKAQLHLPDFSWHSG